MSYERILDVIGRLEGTNKSDYGFLESYESIFMPYRDEAFNLLEIGIHQGASLRTWRTYFANAQVVGLDVNPECKQSASDRILIEIGSQDDPEILDRIMTQYSPLIVIDDGSHLAHHIVFSFERIFPRMPSGGLYVVEDFYMHFGSEEREHLGKSPIRCSEYFVSLAARLASRGTTFGENHVMAKHLFDHIESITFLQGAIVLRKKHAPLDGAQKIAAAEAVAAQSKSPAHQLGLVRVLLSCGGSTHRSEEIIDRLIAEHGITPETLFRLSEVLELENRIGEAITTLEQAMALKNGWSLLVDPIHVLYRIGSLYLRVGAPEQAVHITNQLIELRPNFAEGRRLRAVALEQAGKFHEAIEEAKRAAAITTDERLSAVIMAAITRIQEKICASAG